MLAFFLVISGLNLAAAPSVNVKPAPAWLLPVTPAGKAASVKDVSGGYYMSFVDTQINLDQKTTYQKFVREIVTEAGIQNGSEFSVTFDPLYEHIDIHDVAVIRNGQRIPQMNVSDFKVIPVETDRQRFIYNGYYAASLILKDIRKGDKIEISYSRIGWNPVFQNKYSGNLSFYSFDYTSHIHAAIIAKKGRKFFLREFNNPPAKTVKASGDNDVYEWDLKNVKNIPYDDYVPYWYNKQPFVQISEFASWEEVVNWGLGFYQTPPIGGALKDKVEEWKKSSNTKFEFIEKAIRFVQDEIRYLGIETGENSHKPHRPEDVFAQRYGDCKDKAFLLCAILRYNAIDCDPFLVDSYKGARLSEYLPAPTDFNHVVVRIRIRDEGPRLNDADAFIFADATISLQGGTLSTFSFPAYGQGLLLKAGQKKPMSVPLQHPGYVTAIEDIYLPASGDTSLTGLIQAKTVYFQKDADEMRSYFQESVQAENEENYLNYYRDTYKHAQFDISDTLEYYDQREANNFSLVERYSMKNAWQFDSTRKKYYFNILGKLLYDQLTILPNRKRKDPIHLKYPYHNTYTIRVHMPGAWNVPSESWNIERAAYKIGFKSQFIAAENVWELSYDYETLQDHVALSQAAEYRKDIEKLTNNLEFQLSDPGISSVSNVGSDNANWWMIVLAVLTLAATIVALRKCYRYSPLAGQYHYPAREIGGWLIFISFSMAVQPFVLLVTVLINLGGVYFSKSGWNAIAGYGDSGSLVFYQVFLVAEMLLNVVFIGLSAFVSILFFKKRDSYPYFFSIFLGANLLFVLADSVVTSLLFGDIVTTASDGLGRDIVRQVITAALIIPYLQKSTRVKQTFVNTYGENLIHEPSQASQAVDNVDSELS